VLVAKAGLDVRGETLDPRRALVARDSSVDMKVPKTNDGVDQEEVADGHENKLGD
jgi:hypothetical protein